ncbi:MAG: HEAT repeat domain-containing protein [Armatimonadetes bacterium]|nr:HEAT repeat domain-containing protein [Armatimonadota bacterium]
MSTDLDPKNEPRTTEELIRIALTEEDEDAAWDAVVALHRRGNREVLEAARGLCQSPSPKEQALGANILGQLGSPELTFPDESVEILLQMLETDTDPEVLYSLGIALGHIHDPRAIEPLSQLKRHPIANVRYGIVFGLLGHEDETAVRTLIDLTRDKDVEVRNWATFGLSQQIDLDTREIQDALLARIADPHPSTRAEALYGLALRENFRIIDRLKWELNHIEGICPLEDVYEDYAMDLIIKAAVEIGHPELLPVLEELHEGPLEEDVMVEIAIRSTPLRMEARERGACLAKGDLSLMKTEESGWTGALSLGEAMQILPEGQEEQKTVRLISGPLEVEPGDTEEVLLAFIDDVTLSCVSLMEESPAYEIFSGELLIGRGYFERVWKPKSGEMNHA